MATINEYIDQLKTDRVNLVNNLETKGISDLSGEETFTELVPKVLDIETGGGQVIQYDIVPIASSENEGQIIQYIGVTDSTYINGFFYKCVENTGVYSWVNIDVQPLFLPVSVEDSTSTYTISALQGNYSYKLGTKTSITITSSTASDLETIIYFESGATGTAISLPDSITNIGDAPELTLASNVNTGTCETNKHYIISIINNIAVWKAY